MPDGKQDPEIKGLSLRDGDKRIPCDLQSIRIEKDDTPCAVPISGTAMCTMASFASALMISTARFGNSDLAARRVAGLMKT